MSSAPLCFRHSFLHLLMHSCVQQDFVKPLLCAGALVDPPPLRLGAVSLWGRRRHHGIAQISVTDWGGGHASSLPRVGGLMLAERVNGMFRGHLSPHPH